MDKTNIDTWTDDEFIDGIVRWCNTFEELEEYKNHVRHYRRFLKIIGKMEEKNIDKCVDPEHEMYHSKTKGSVSLCIACGKSWEGKP